jgi:nucleoside-diphosphate-sugar epimerase
MNRILIIGGTGNVGREVVDQLSATGARFRTMSRKPDAAALRPQIEVVRGISRFPRRSIRASKMLIRSSWYGSHRRRLRQVRWNESRTTRGESCSSQLR